MIMDDDEKSEDFMVILLGMQIQNYFTGNYKTEMFRS